MHASHHGADMEAISPIDLRRQTAQREGKEGVVNPLPLPQQADSAATDAMLRNPKKQKIGAGCSSSRRSKSPERGGLRSNNCCEDSCGISPPILPIIGNCGLSVGFKSKLKGLGENDLNPSAPHLNAPHTCICPSSPLHVTLLISPKDTTAKPWRCCRRRELMNEACL